MRYCLLFEDNEKSPSSILLKSLSCKIDFEFSNGNESLQSKLNSIYDGERRFIMFVDYPPNKENLVTLYRTLCNRNRKHKNVFLN